jgi:7,8-dihydro-6-hydroxymethylpterin-pyrophosphokinase
MCLKNLTIPHPEILVRDFVLLPLNDLNPQLSHPDWAPKTLKSALSGLQKKYVDENPETWEFQY